MSVSPAVAFREALQGKTLVVDTSSLLLAGVSLLPSLPPCTLVVPAVVVKELEEKRTQELVGQAAREWLRLLESLRSAKGMALAQGLPMPTHEDIMVRVEPNHSCQKSLPEHLRDGSNDSTVLAVALNLSREMKEGLVGVLSNDMPMRLHATLDLGLPAWEFSSTLASGAKPYSGRSTCILDEAFYTSSSLVGLGDEEDLALEVGEQEAHNILIDFTLASGESLGTRLAAGGRLHPVARKQRFMGVTARTLEQDVAYTYLAAPPEELPLVSLAGRAGTGKTLLSVAVGIEGVRRGAYQKVLVFRSLHEMGRGQELGFLPGGVDEKMEAWAGAVHDALDVIAKAEKQASGSRGSATPKDSKALQEYLEVSPITYLRGRSLSNTFIILDEAQNFSRSELLNILTRAGEGTKVVLLFDAEQVDNRFLQSGPRADVWSVVHDLKREPLFAHMTLTRTERSQVAALAASLLSGE